MFNDLLLMSGVDIPFPQAQITIHQPKIKEIALIGEDAFFLGCEMLNFSKDLLNLEDQDVLKDKTNFDIFISIMRNKDSKLKKNKIYVKMLLSLIFPNYKFNFNKDNIEIIKDSDNDNKENNIHHKLNNDNFEAFKEIISKMFCLNNKENKYNPSGEMAARIAAKLNKGQALVAKSKGVHKETSIISRYVSILAIGNKQDINSLCDYTVYQLFDAFNRYELKYDFDMHIKAKMAGAKDLKEVENWMKDIHS